MTLPAGEIRIFLADDHALFREGVVVLLGSHPDLLVVGQAGNADDTVVRCESLRPDVAVVDLAMPGDGVRAIERVTSASPATRTLVLTMHDDSAYVQAAMSAGASGYVLKGAASEELIAAIRVVAAGKSYVRVSVGHGGMRGIASTRSDPPLAIFSRREQEVLRLVAGGLTSREIGEKLGLGTKTVDTYRTRIHAKLGVEGRAGLVAYALRRGILVSSHPER